MQMKRLTSLDFPRTTSELLSTARPTDPQPVHISEMISVNNYVPH